MKNSKKKIIFIIFTVILGLAATSGISVFAAYKYFSSDVQYGSQSVENALNDLYSNQKVLADVYYLGTGTSINVKNKLPNDYSKLTVNDFIIGTTKADAKQAQYQSSTPRTHASGGFNGFELTKSYNSSTGVLTLSGNTYRTWAFKDNTFGGYPNGDAHTDGTVTPFAYAVVGNIQ